MQLRGAAAHPEVSTPGWGGGGPGEKPPPAAFSQGRCKPPGASAAGALRSPVQEEKIPFQKGSFINANKS